MLHATIFTLDVEMRLSAMQRLIRDFGHEDMPQELENWQRDDMRRQFTNMETPNYVTAETRIWPRSRTYDKTHRERPLPKRLRRALTSRPRLIVGATGVPSSQRPILRPELFDKLCARMADLMERKLAWRSTFRP
jgi:hypothetical protein